jgi:hypothetical protein
MVTLETFRDSLDAKDRLIHDLASKMLKTRYSVTRSNAFLRFTVKMKA